MAAHSPRARRAALLLGVTLALLGAGVVACKPASDTGNAAAARPPAGTAATAAGAARPASELLARADSGRIRGSAAAPIWIVEISDFQCPFCKMWHDSTYPAIVREYVETGKARLAYINFPLGNHPNAVPAAEAAMCASVQGKFWEMQNAVFATQERWARLPDAVPFYDSLATREGVAMPAWRECMSTHATLPLIEADRDRGSAAGVSSTPSFLIGNEAIAGAQPIGAFREVVERALRSAAPR